MFDVFIGIVCGMSSETYLGVLISCILWGIVSFLYGIIFGRYSLFKEEVSIKHPESRNILFKFIYIEWFSAFTCAIIPALITHFIKSFF